MRWGCGAAGCCLNASCPCCSAWHKTDSTESQDGLGWKRPPKPIVSNPPATSRDTCNPIRLLKPHPTSPWWSPGIPDPHGTLPAQDILWPTLLPTSNIYSIRGANTAWGSRTSAVVHSSPFRKSPHLPVPVLTFAPTNTMLQELSGSSQEPNPSSVDLKARHQGEHQHQRFLFFPFNQRTNKRGVTR